MPKFDAKGGLEWSPQELAEWAAIAARQKVFGGTGPNAGHACLKDRRKPWQKACLTFSFDRTGTIATPRQGPRQ